MWKYLKLGFRPFYNSNGVEDTDFDGKTFKMLLFVCSAYLPKDNSNEE